MTLDLASLRSLLAAQRPVLLVDVRSLNEISRLRSVGALHLPVDVRDTGADWPSRLAAYKGCEVVAACVYPRSKRTAALASRLSAAGFSAHEFAPGMVQLLKLEGFRPPEVDGAPPLRLLPKLKVWQLAA